MFKVIEGGGGQPSATKVETDPVLLIRNEGRRRLQLVGLERYEARERSIGTPIPTKLRHYKLQIEFVIQVLSRLSPVPDDISADRYWPQLEMGDLGEAPPLSRRTALPFA
jgi:hypothetical protein